MNKKFAVFILVFLGFSSLAQEYDYARFMHLNMLYYRQANGGCNNTTNNPAVKENALIKVLDYVQPDIFSANEIGADYRNGNYLLTNSLNVNGTKSWKQADYTNNSFSNITNMLFYNSEVFELKKQDKVTKNLSGSDLTRVIDIYTLYYLDENNTYLGDTTFIHYAVAHLKAGSGSAEKAKRAEETEALMHYLENNYTDGNIFFAGDFNLYTSSESAYQNLLNYPTQNWRFLDPINVPGSWNSNSSFASVHTQSTRFTGNNCFTGGGVDSRFDFILISEEVKNETNRIKYISNSYETVGQDGKRYNQDIISPANSSVPKGVDTALYNLSDHLPIKLDVQIEKYEKPVGVDNIQKPIVTINYVNNDVILSSDKAIKVKITVFNLLGAQLDYLPINLSPKSNHLYSINNLPNGIYLIQLESDGKVIGSQKISKLK